MAQTSVQRAREIVSSCFDSQDDMTERDYDFYIGIKNRLDLYGDETSVSEAQLQWLEDIQCCYGE